MITLAFDTTVLSGFARSGDLDVLERITSQHRRVATRAVVDELEQGVLQYPELREAIDAEWLGHVRADTLRELLVFGECSRRLGTAQRNIGECSTIAWAEIHDAIAVTDDQVAYNLCRERGVRVCRSLRLLASALRSGLLQETEADAVVERLLAKGTHLPFATGLEFLEWVRSQTVPISIVQ
jgi:predicted nucleic acid-binding protein